MDAWDSGSMNTASSKLTKEKISYELDLQLPAPLMFRVVETVAKLPYSVYEFVLNNVQFKMSCNCMVPKKNFKKKYVVFLKNGCSEFTVAHEIAHA